MFIGVNMKILLILATILCSSLVVAEDWKWVKATNVVGGWGVEKGRAEVEIKDSDFVARLFSGDDPLHEVIYLKGTIENGKITVEETIHNTDYFGSTYKGTHSKKTWDGFADSTGAESITLSDGWGMIGINKKLNDKHNKELKSDAAKGSAP
jgi:hypothetical protein